MSTPLLNTIFTILTTANVPLAILCFIMAGMQLRGEGGINYDANGGFFRWIAWGAVMLTIAPIMSWLSAEGITAAGNLGGLAGARSLQPYGSSIVPALTDFVNNVLVARLVPVVAGALVLKALLDSSEGHSPIPSIVSSLFLLGISGFATMAQGWVAGDQYATTELLQSMLNWAMTSVSPVIGVICIYGAIIQYVRRKDWATAVFVGIAFLGVSGIWTLVKGWVGVSL
jgi:hypothetical protein